jgi:hypothetical protein
MNCPVCDHTHFKDIQKALLQRSSYQSLAATHEIPVCWLERHHRHQRRLSFLDCPIGADTFTNAPYGEKLVILADAAEQALNNAFENNDQRAAHHALTRLNRLEARLARWQDPLYQQRLERDAARRAELQAAIERERERHSKQWAALLQEMNVLREILRENPDHWEYYCGLMREAGVPVPDAG